MPLKKKEEPIVQAINKKESQQEEQIEDTKEIGEKIRTKKIVKKETKTTQMKTKLLKKSNAEKSKLKNIVKDLPFLRFPLVHLLMTMEDLGLTFENENLFSQIVDKLCLDEYLQTWQELLIQKIQCSDNEEYKENIYSVLTIIIQERCKKNTSHVLWEILWEKALDTMSKYFNFKKTRKKTNPKPHELLDQIENETKQLYFAIPQNKAYITIPLFLDFTSTLKKFYTLCHEDVLEIFHHQIPIQWEEILFQEFCERPIQEIFEKFMNYFFIKNNPIIFIILLEILKQ